MFNEIQKDPSPTLQRRVTGALCIKDSTIEKRKQTKTKDQILKDIERERAFREAATMVMKENINSYEDSGMNLDEGRHDRLIISEAREPTASAGNDGDNVIDDIITEAREQVMKINNELEMKDREDIEKENNTSDDTPTSTRDQGSATHNKSVDELLQEAREALGITQKGDTHPATVVSENENAPVKIFESNLDALYGSLDDFLARHGI